METYFKNSVRRNSLYSLSLISFKHTHPFCWLRILETPCGNSYAISFFCVYWCRCCLFPLYWQVANLYCRLKVQSQNGKVDQQTEGTKSNNDVLLSNLQIPCPWSNPRTVESIHPVRDDYKLCKTVKLPGAKCLYLRFDPRCATQYEYDKVLSIQLWTLLDNSKFIVAIWNPVVVKIRYSSTMT